MTEDEATELARAAAKTARKRRPSRPAPMTLAGVEEATRGLDMLAQHANPEAVFVLVRLRALLSTELKKQSQARAAGRAEAVRFLYANFYRPRGYGVRAAARDILENLAGMKAGAEYRAEPKRSISRIVQLNGKAPSEGTIKKDLENIDLSDD
ncbi:hypothetical protein RMR21_004345 [Agrobacterium sp. rho-8.1]|nr:hypothetical protein [Agrobacterium sp. rho-8.1]